MKGIASTLLDAFLPRHQPKDYGLSQLKYSGDSKTWLVPTSTGAYTRTTEENDLPEVVYDDRDMVTIKKETPTDILGSLGQQVGIGGFLGLASGLAVKKIGKALLILVGTEMCILQYMAWRGWLRMNWRQLAHDVRPKFDKSTLDGVINILVYKLPWASSFTAGKIERSNSVKL